jgi:phosphoribosylglycinamide formyltransferase-1
MQAIVAANTGLDVRAVIANSPDAAGLTWAAERGIPTQCIDHRQFSTREAFDGELATAIEAHEPRYVLLAGFMRILTPAFVARFAGRMINIHPSLLPAFTGLHTHRRALEAGVTVHGATVHFVTAELDHGPIIAQAAVPVLQGDTEEALAARVLAQEHRLYPMVARWLANGLVRLAEDGRVHTPGHSHPADALLSPREGS